MSGSVIVWDLETVPDLRGFAAANGLAGKTDEEVREAIGGQSFDAGLLLQEAERKLGLRRRLTKAMPDHHDRERVRQRCSRWQPRPLKGPANQVQLQGARPSARSAS
jgi:hypothetical protein